MKYLVMMSLFGFAWGQLTCPDTKDCRCQDFYLDDCRFPPPSTAVHAADIKSCKDTCDVFASFGECEFFSYTTRGGVDENCVIYGGETIDEFKTSCGKIGQPLFDSNGNCFSDGCGNSKCASAVCNDCSASPCDDFYQVDCSYDNVAQETSQLPSWDICLAFCFTKTDSKVTFAAIDVESQLCECYASDVMATKKCVTYIVSQKIADPSVCEGTKNECTIDGDCPGSGLQCPNCQWCDTANLVCKNGCASDANCAPGEHCSAAHVCEGAPGCTSDADCAGANQLCPGCEWCDVSTGVCEAGCADNANCPAGSTCNGAHVCVSAGQVLLKEIHLATAACAGCQNTPVEDGPVVTLQGQMGADGMIPRCSTNQLDHADVVDYAPGVDARFKDEADRDVLGACYDYALNSRVEGGEVEWTAPVGTWTPAGRLVKISWTDSSLAEECCCMDRATLSPTDPKANLASCSAGQCATGC